MHKKVTDSEKAIRVSIDEMQITDIKLGKGEYGAVKVAAWENSSVAVKIFSSEIIRESYLGQTFQSELVLCSKLLHSNVTTVYGFSRVKYGSCMATMELLQGSLDDVLEVSQLSRQYLTLREQLDVTRDCLKGLYYLHTLVSLVISFCLPAFLPSFLLAHLCLSVCLCVCVSVSMCLCLCVCLSLL
jgi:serine/threonine protein kinase